MWMPSPSLGTYSSMLWAIYFNKYIICLKNWLDIFREIQIYFLKSPSANHASIFFQISSLTRFRSFRCSGVSPATTGGMPWSVIGLRSHYIFFGDVFRSDGMLGERLPYLDALLEYYGRGESSS